MLEIRSAGAADYVRKSRIEEELPDTLAALAALAATAPTD